MDKLIELIERHRDKWQKKWYKGTQLRDSNSEHYDPFLHGESVGATKAYNNVLQWMKSMSIMSREKDLALTWEDVKRIEDLCMEVTTFFAMVGRNKDILEPPFYEEVARRFNSQREKK